MIEELEDAIFKNHRIPVSYSELAALKEGRFNASIQHRLAELEGLRGTHFCTFFADWFSGLHCFEQFFDISIPGLVFMVLGQSQWECHRSVTWQSHYEERGEGVSWDVRGMSSP